MNPLDLADCLEAFVKNNRDSFVKDAVQAIRSQYAEIQAHKKTNALLAEKLDKQEKANKVLEEGYGCQRLSDKELIVFLMDEIDKASQLLVEGETHMAIATLGQCHAEIRKHFSK